MDKAHDYPGLFLALEGPHGAGKSTQLRRLTEWLSTQGYHVRATRELGGTALGEQLRALIQDPDNASCLASSPKSLLFLVLAARTLHVQQVIRPALTEGKIVICERFEGSTYAIQHCAEQLDWDAICQIHAFATEGVTPDRSILLDVPAELGIARRKTQAAAGFWRARAFEYHERVAKGYREAAHGSAGWLVIDATQHEESVFADLQQRLRPFLEHWSADKVEPEAHQISNS